MARLGFKSGKTELKQDQAEYYDGIIKEGSLLCKPQAAFLRLAVQVLDGQTIQLEKGPGFRSRDLASLLQKSEQVVIMAATVGKVITDSIKNKMKQGMATVSLIYDAVASETADAILDYLVEYINTMILREQKRLTKVRYSPGYGDLDLKDQKKIFKILSLEKMGLSLTRTFMLIPEKSVTAIAGIEKIEAG